MASGTRNQPRTRLIIATVAIGILICAIIPPLVLGLVQLCVVTDRQYGDLILGLVRTSPYILILPGLLGTSVWVGTLIYVFERRRGDLKSAVPLLVAILVLNILAVAYYWVRELRQAWLSRAGGIPGIPGTRTDIDRLGKNSGDT